MSLVRDLNEIDNKTVMIRFHELRLFAYSSYKPSKFKVVNNWEIKVGELQHAVDSQEEKKTYTRVVNEWMKKSQLVTTKRGGKNERKIGTRWRWRDESEEKSQEESRTLYLYRIFFVGFIHIVCSLITILAWKSHSGNSAIVVSCVTIFQWSCSQYVQMENVARIWSFCAQLRFVRFAIDCLQQEMLCIDSRNLKSLNKLFVGNQCEMCKVQMIKNDCKAELYWSEVRKTRNLVDCTTLNSSSMFQS